MRRYTGDFFILAIAYLSSAFFPFSFPLFVLFINLQYFQVQACVLTHGGYTLAKKPFDNPRFITILKARQMTPRVLTVP